MKPGMILRVGIYLMGLWALYNGTTGAVYYVHARFSSAGFGPDLFTADDLSVFAYAIVPLLFALGCFGFAGSISRLLLGDAGNLGSSDNVKTTHLLRVSVKLLGLYFLGVFGPPLLATFFELIAIRSGNRQLNELQMTSDMISNTLGVAFGLWLALRTGRVTAMFFADEKAG